MGKHQKLLAAILRGASDSNIPFDGLRGLLLAMGFEERVRGDHHIFTRSGIDEILNLQPKQGKAKAYQVRQVRDIIIKYGLSGDDNE